MAVYYSVYQLVFIDFIAKYTYNGYEKWILILNMKIGYLIYKI